MASIRALCKTGVLLENGSVKFTGSAEDTIVRYQASNVNSNGIALKDRKDKQGDQRIVVTNVVFRNEQGVSIDELFVGQPLIIDFQFEVKDASIDLSKLIIACNFTDNFGNPLVIWCSDEMDQSFSCLMEGKVRLRVANMNLRPNIYTFNYQFSLSSTSPKDWCDSLSNVAHLTVLSEKTENSSKIITRSGYSAILPAEFLV